jgi:hypothetical protein
MVWDRTNNVMYVCVTTGSSSTAVWTAINPSSDQLVWTIADRVSSAPGAADEGTSYIVASSFGSFVTGDIITDNGTGQFTVTQPGTDVGWIAYVQDEDRYYSFQASAWVLNGLLPAAGDTEAGKIETATAAEMEAGSSVAVAVTPGRQHSHPGHPKAWVNLHGSDTFAITTDYGVASAADNGTGLHTLTFDTAYSSADAYTCGGGWCRSNEASGDTAVVSAFSGSTKTTTTFQILTVDPEDNTPIDSAEVGLIFVGDH